MMECVLNLRESDRKEKAVVKKVAFQISLAAVALVALVSLASNVSAQDTIERRISSLKDRLERLTTAAQTLNDSLAGRSAAKHGRAQRLSTGPTPAAVAEAGAASYDETSARLDALQQRLSRINAILRQRKGQGDEKPQQAAALSAAFPDISGQWQDRDGNQYQITLTGDGESARVRITIARTASQRPAFYSIRGRTRQSSPSQWEVAAYVDGLYPATGQISGDEGTITWQAGRGATFLNAARWTKVGFQPRPPSPQQEVAGRVKLNVAGTDLWLRFPAHSDFDEQYLVTCTAADAETFDAVRSASGEIHFQVAGQSGFGLSGNFINDGAGTQWRAKQAGGNTWQFEVAQSAGDSPESWRDKVMAAPREVSGYVVLLPKDELSQRGNYYDRFEVVTVR